MKHSPARFADTLAADALPLCAHCGLDVPAGLVDPDAERQFCCAGCRAVNEAIVQLGLGRFYELRDEDDPRRPATTTGDGYAAFDHPAFHERYVTDADDGRSTVELYVEDFIAPPASG